jgi:hypothetical protein
MNDEGHDVLLLRPRGAADWRQGLAFTPEVKAGEVKPAGSETTASS